MRFLPGIVLSILLAFLALGISRLAWFQAHGLSILTVAIVLGMVFGNLGYHRVERWAGPGVGIAKQKLLRLGIILFGLKLTLDNLVEVGISGILIDAVMVASTFILCWWMGRKLFRMDPATTILIGAGASICGAAAVLAAEPVVKGKGEQVAVAVATVVIFGTLAMFLYPFLQVWWPLSDKAFGIYIGSTVHEVAQVAAAGQQAGEEAAGAAVIAKMVRVMMLAPFLLLLSFWLLSDKMQTLLGTAGSLTKRKLVIPWFAVGFIVMIVVNSYITFPGDTRAVLIRIDDLLLAAAMAALGLTTHLSMLRKAGKAPILLAGLLFVWLCVGGAVINLAFARLF